MRRPLRVMHVLPTLSTGGMEKFAVDLIIRFERARIYPLVCCLDNYDGGLCRLISHNGTPLFHIQKSGFGHLRFINALKECFIREKADVVHTWSGVYRDATIAARLAGIPLNVHTDQGKFYPDSPWIRFNHRFFSNFRDKIVAVSDELRKFLVEEVRINPNKIVTIYNGIDISLHRITFDSRAKKKELGISQEDKVIGIVARLVPVKDHETLFRAFKNVREKYGRVKLLVVGSGLLEDELNKFTRGLGEDKNIIFLGNRSDVSELLHIMDIVCLSSLSEGLSLTLLEAMASARPVVATDVGGNPELIKDDVTGLLVPPQDPQKMAQAILALLNDSALSARLGGKAQEYVQANFDIRRIVEQYQKLYFDLAKTKGLV